jgi:chromosome segregation ATPase
VYVLYAVCRALVAELQSKVMALQMQCVEQQQALDRERAVGATSSAATQQLEAARAECEQLRGEVAALKSDKSALAETVSQLQGQMQAEREGAQQERHRHAEVAAALEARLAEAHAGPSDAGANSTPELEDLRGKLAAAETTVKSLTQALDDVAQRSVQAADQSAAEVASLQQQLAATASHASNGGGRADADEMKAIMQDVYARVCEVFDADAPEGTEAQYSAQDVTKRLRGVLKKVTSERS